jgi:hypothetical protein
MSRDRRNDSSPEPWVPIWSGPSERESHSEHRAALEATVFRPDPHARELVLELEAGELRLRRAPRA